MWQEDSNLVDKKNADCDNFGLPYCEDMVLKGLIIFFVCLILAIISLVTMVLLVLLIRKRWNNYEFFTIFLFFNNFILGVEPLVQGAISYLHGKWISSEVGANISGFIFAFHCITYITILVLILIEKYIASLHRLWHIMNFKPCLSITILIFVYLFGIAISILPVLIGPEFDYIFYPGVLTALPVKTYKYMNISFIIIIGFLAYLLLGIILIFRCHIGIAIRVRKLIKEKSLNRGGDSKRAERDFHYYVVHLMGSKIAFLMAIKFLLCWLTLGVVFELYALESVHVLNIDLGATFDAVARWAPYIVHAGAAVDPLVAYVFHFRLRAKVNRILRSLTGVFYCLGSMKNWCKKGATGANNQLKISQRLITLEQYKDVRG